jgi:hypothetical protein
MKKKIRASGRLRLLLLLLLLLVLFILAGT